MKSIITLLALLLAPTFLFAQNSPVAVDDSVAKMQDVFITEVYHNVLENDYDPDGAPIRILEIKQPINGNASFTDSSIAYQSGYVYIGEDIVEYRIVEVNDTNAISNWAALKINILPDPTFPVAENDYAQTFGGFPVTTNLLKNDIDPEGDTLVLHHLPIHGNFFGEVEKLTDSIVEYMPYNVSRDGIDTMVYYIARQDSPLPIARGYFIVEVGNIHFYDSLDVNNINAGVNANGYLFNMYEGGIYRQHFTVPGGSNTNSLFSQTVWMGGLNNGELHVAGERYRQIGEDFWAGPVSSEYDSLYDIQWKRVWKLSKSEILYHMEQWQEPGYVPVENIASWPGNGNTSNGQMEKIAPFFDQDQDGNYEPMEGDYPLIRGDQAVFIVYNDARDVHTETGGEQLGLEIHAMLYAFDDPQDSVMFNTVFGHFDFVNRSQLDYDSVYLGIFTDFHLGYGWDDYIQCDVQRGSYFAYNGEDIDGNGQPGAYGEHPPAQGVTILAGPYLDANGMDDPDGGCDASINGLHFGDGVVDNERMGMQKFISIINSGGTIGDPQVADEYYQIMKGYWRDNAPMMYGGNGHELWNAVGPECNFMFPNETDTCNWGTGGVPPNGGFNQNGYYWTEETVDNYPSDRRGLGVCGPFTFTAGMVQEVDLAFVFARDFNGGPWESVELLKSRIDILLEKVDNGEIIPLPPGYEGIEDNGKGSGRLLIYPQPAHNLVYLEYTSITEKARCSIIDLTGKIIISERLSSHSRHRIDLTKLPQGFYLIQVSDGQQRSYAKMIKH